MHISTNFVLFTKNCKEFQQFRNYFAFLSIELLRIFKQVFVGWSFMLFDIVYHQNLRNRKFWVVFLLNAINDIESTHISNTIRVQMKETHGVPYDEQAYKPLLIDIGIYHWGCKRTCGCQTSVMEKFGNLGNSCTKQVADKLCIAT